MNPQKYIKPITYQLKPKASVIIENKVRIENRSTKKISFTMYMSNDLNIRVVYESNKILNNFPYRIMKIAPNNDLVIKNVGFINIKDECQLGIYTEDFAVYESRKSFF